MKRFLSLCFLILGVILLVPFLSPVGGSTLSCTVELGNSTCGNGGTKVISLMNDTGGYQNAHGEVVGGTSGAAWWNTSWTYRMNLSFANQGVSGSAVNETILVRLNASNFEYAGANTTGKDLRFIDADGSTELSYEIELWNTSGTSYIWVLVPAISTNVATDFIWLYYGNPSVNSTENASGAWDDAFRFVTHLNTAINGTSDIRDSTRFENHGNSTGVSSASAVSDLLGGGYNITNSSAYGEIGRTTTMEVSLNPFFWEMVYKRENNNASNYWLVDKRDNSGGGVGYELRHTSSGGTFMRIDEGAANQQAGLTYVVNDTQYHYIRAGRNSTHVVICADGANCVTTADATPTNITNSINNTLFSFQLGQNSNSLLGYVDEFRLYISPGASAIFGSNSLRVQNASIFGSLISYGSTETNGVYNNSICCIQSGTTLSSSCGTTFLKLSGVTDAHAQQANYSDYSYSLCLSGTNATTSCTYADTTCPNLYSCVASIANADGSGLNGTNAHLGACSDYTRKVCCWVRPYSVCINETGSCYATITAAVSAASAGQTIVITDNETYSEATIAITKTLTITSNSTTGMPVIYGNNTTAISIATAGVTVNITNVNLTAIGNVDPGYVLYASANNIHVNVVDAAVYGHLTGSTSRTILASGSGTVITMNRTLFHEGTATYGIMMQSSAHLIMDYCNVSGEGQITYPSGTAYFDISNTILNQSDDGTMVNVAIANLTNITAYRGDSSTTASMIAIGDQNAGTPCNITNSFINASEGLSIDHMCQVSGVTVNATNRGISICNYNDDTCTGITIRDSTVVGSVTRLYFDVSGVTAAVRNVTVLNSTIGFGNIGTSGVNSADALHIYFQYYLDAYINYTNGQPTSGAAVTTRDNASTSVSSVTTNSLGYITTQNITYLYQLRNATNTYNNFYENHTVNATLGGASNQTSVNMSSNQNVTLTLAILPVCVQETNACWSTIQQAIDNATSGQTVIITDTSTYNEAVIVNKSLTLTSNASSTWPRLNYTGSSSANYVINVTAANVNISKVFLSGTSTIAYTSVVISNATNTRLENVSIEANSTTALFGFYSTANTPALERVNISINSTTAAEGSAAIYFTGQSGVINYTNAVTTNGIVPAIELYDSGSNTITHSNFNRTWNGNGFTLLIYNSGTGTGTLDNTVTNSTVNGKPILYTTSDLQVITNASSYGSIVFSSSAGSNLTSDRYGGELQMSGSSVTAINMTLTNNYTSGIPCFVCTSFTAYNSTINFVDHAGSTVNGIWGTVRSGSNDETFLFDNVTMHVNGSSSKAINVVYSFGIFRLYNSFINISNIGNAYGIEMDNYASGSIVRDVANTTFVISSSNGALSFAVEGNVTNSTFNLTFAGAIYVGSTHVAYIRNSSFYGTGSNAYTYDGVIRIEGSSGTSTNRSLVSDIFANITSATPLFATEGAALQIHNSTLYATGNVFEFSANSGIANSTYNLTNVTWDNSSYSFAGCTPVPRWCNITANWYVSALVNESVNALPLAGASVNVTGSHGLEVSSTTNSSGQVLTTATEYTRNSTAITYFTNHAVNAGKARFANNSTTVNVTSGNKATTFVLYPNVPTQSTPVLNATDYPINSSAANITCWNQSTSDVDYDTIRNIYTWSLNGNSILPVYLPFDTDISQGNGRTVRNYGDSLYNASFETGGAAYYATWNSSGKRGGSYTFDSTAGKPYLRVGDVPTPQAITVSAWIYPYSDMVGTSAGGRIVSKALEYSLWIDESGYLFAELNTTGGAIYDYFNYTNATTGRTWWHVAFTFDNTTKTARLYRNGTLVNETTTTDELADTTGTLSVGGLGTNGNDPFTGVIDEVRVYNVSLSASQMTQLYQEDLYALANSTILANETTRGEQWSCSVYGNDNLGDSAVATSLAITIENTLPTHIDPWLNASDSPLNRTNSTFTCYNLSTYDDDGDSVTNIYHWLVNGSDYALALLPFDTNTSDTINGSLRDYAGNDTNGTLGNGSATTAPQWTSAGKIGGAYSFDGLNDTIALVDDQLDISGALSLAAWIYPQSNYTSMVIFSKDNGSDSPWELVLLANGSLQSYTANASAGSTQLLNSSINLSIATWSHVVFVRTTSALTFFINGVQDTAGWQTYTRSTAHPSSVVATIGSNADFLNGFFNGSIDDVQLFNRSLSAEQVSQLYLQGTNLSEVNSVLPQETDVSETWACEVTPNDGFGDGLTKRSNNLSVIGSPPSVPVLHLPLNDNNTVYERYPYFNWSPSSDTQGDAITYSWNISSPSGCAVIPQQNTTNTYYTSLDKLCVDQPYNWTVCACDPVDGCSAFASYYNFTIASVVGLTFVENTVEFGTLDLFASASTIANSPAPLVYNNTGNVDSNVSTRANAVLWSTQPLGTSYFQFADENSTSWQNYEATYELVYDNLSYQATPRELELNITSPANEPTGYKNTTITVLGASVE